MGDQDLNLKYDSLKKILNIEEKEFEKLFFRTKNFQKDQELPLLHFGNHLV